MKTNGDDSINPISESNVTLEGNTYGLTKREYFAAIAMQGLLPEYNLMAPNNVISERAVKLADELIKSLNEVEK